MKRTNWLKSKVVGSWFCLNLILLPPPHSWCKLLNWRNFLKESGRVGEDMARVCVCVCVCTVLQKDSMREREREREIGERHTHSPKRREEKRVYIDTMYRFTLVDNILSSSHQPLAAAAAAAPLHPLTTCERRNRTTWSPSTAEARRAVGEMLGMTVRGRSSSSSSSRVARRRPIQSSYHK